jgi:hypothetical protein
METQLLIRHSTHENEHHDVAFVDESTEIASPNEYVLDGSKFGVGYFLLLISSITPAITASSFLNIF